MMRCKRFEIWIADLNPKIGTEPGKVRPVIIVQTDLLNKHHPSSIVCPVTTKVRKELDILRVHLKKGSCGLEEGCDIMVDQIRAIDNKRLLKKVGQVPPELWPRISVNLKILLDLE